MRCFSFMGCSPHSEAVIAATTFSDGDHADTDLLFSLSTGTKKALNPKKLLC